jgi:hypothetical protein
MIWSSPVQGLEFLSIIIDTYSESFKPIILFYSFIYSLIHQTFTWMCQIPIVCMLGISCMVIKKDKLLLFTASFLRIQETIGNVTCFLWLCICSGLQAKLLLEMLVLQVPAGQWLFLLERIKSIKLHWIQLALSFMQLLEMPSECGILKGRSFRKCTFSIWQIQLQTVITMLVKSNFYSLRS